MKITIVIITLFLSTAIFSSLYATTDEPGSQGYVDITVENIVIDTQRMAIAAETLSASIDQLSQSIAKLAVEGATFEPKDRQALIAATKSVDQASQSLTALARQIPLTAQQLSEALPEAITQSQQSIGQISTSIESANRALKQISDSAPETIKQGENLVDRLLDSALQKITFYVIIVLILLLSTIGGLIYYSYRTVIQPLILLLQELKVVPEQMAEMSRLIKQTSENLLLIQHPPVENSEVDI